MNDANNKMTYGKVIQMQPGATRSILANASTELDFVLHDRMSDQ